MSKRKSTGWLVAGCLLAVMAGCAKQNPVGPEQTPPTGKLAFSLAAEDNIASGAVTIAKGSITQVLPIIISNHSGSVTFSDIQVGTWDIAARLYDAQGVEIFSGQAQALVNRNATTTVAVTVVENTGQLQIVVELPATPTPTPNPGGAEPLVFQGNDGLVYTINTDGTNQRLVGSLGYFGNNFRGGQEIIYTDLGSDFSQRGIWAITFDGSSKRRILPAPADGTYLWPCWSWSGNKIAVAYGYAPRHRILVADADGQNIQYLTDGTDYCYHQCWTPDNRIVYTQETENAGSPAGIYIMNADGSGNSLIKAMPAGHVADSSDCSQDYKLLYFSDESGNYDIYTMNLDGSAVTRLTNDPANDLNPHFSRDGQRIVFSSSRNGGYGIYLMDQNGGNQTYVTAGQAPFFVY